MIDSRLASVGAAISIQEGMHVPKAQRAHTPCWTHKNPGNINVHNNQSYPTLQLGWQALYDLLYQYRTIHGYTLQEAIYHWAPPNENNTETYTQFVEDYTGINRTEPL